MLRASCKLTAVEGTALQQLLAFRMNKVWGGREVTQPPKVVAVSHSLIQSIQVRSFALLFEFPGNAKGSLMLIWVSVLQECPFLTQTLFCFVLFFYLMFSNLQRVESPRP